MNNILPINYNTTIQYTYYKITLGIQIYLLVLLNNRYITLICMI